MINHSRLIYLQRCLVLSRKLLIELQGLARVDNSALVIFFLNQINCFYSYLTRELNK